MIIGDESISIKDVEIMAFFYWLTRAVSKIVFCGLYSLKVYRHQDVYPDGAIIVSNHLSYFDPLLISTCWQEDLHYVASIKLFKIPILKNLLHNLNTYPISGTVKDLNLFKQMCDLLKHGKKVVLFPEGGLSNDGQLKRFKPGIAMLALRCQCAIIPVYIHGTWEIWPRKQRFPNLKGKMACVIGAPILMEEFATLSKRDAHHEMTTRVEESIKNLRDWYTQGAVGLPP